MPEFVRPPRTEDHTESESRAVGGNGDDTVRAPSAPPGPSAAPPADPVFGPPAAPGEVGTLGPYRVVKQLGRGGMGAVYAALDTRLARRLALKVMLPKVAADPEAKDRFLREARAAARVSHDNVVTVYEADDRGGVPYIAMQFLEGYPLDEFLRKKGNPTVPQTLRIAREAAAGLAAAHRVGLVHRDIKPANLWLEAPHGRVKVLDFGLAKPVDGEAEVTKSGMVVGTPAYMSPEQARGEHVDHRTDLFSLGAVLYRLCTGRPPFTGPTTIAVLTALATQDPPPVRGLSLAVPEGLAELIHQLLAKDPAARPASADEVVRRVRAIADESQPNPAAPSRPQVVYVPIQVTALPPDENPFADLDAEDAPTEAVSESTAPAPARRKAAGSWLWPAAGFLALAAATVGGVIVIIKHKDGTETKIEVPEGSTVTVRDKDGKTLATVPPAGKAPAAPGGPDRKAAEWVLSAGGKVRVEGDDRDITAADLPKGGCTLTRVVLSWKPVTDADLANLGGCKGLVYVELGVTGVTDAGLEHFKDCKTLVTLALGRTRVTGEGLRHLKGCAGLEVLSLSETAVTDEALAAVRGWPKLRHLNLWNARTVGDAGIAHLQGAAKLAELNLTGTKVTDAGVAVVGTLPALTHLDLNGTAVSDAGLAHLKGRTGLTRLHLADTRVTDAGLEHLGGLTRLETLVLTKTKVTEAGVKKLAAALPRCQIEWDGGTIAPAAADDRKAAEWVLSAGGWVKVNGEGREIKDPADLPKARFSLTLVNLSNTAVTDAGLASIDGCKGLTSLDLGGTNVTDAGLAHFKDCKELTELWLYGTAVTDLGLAHFKDCKGLTGLHLNGMTKLTGAGLLHFKDCKGLKSLNLGDTAVTDAGLANFKDCKGLTALCLTNTRVTDAGLAHFKDCKGLLQLWVNSTVVTDAGLAHFKDCKSLAYLNLRGTKVTVKGLEEFHAAVPGCKIEHDGGVMEPKK